MQAKSYYQAAKDFEINGVQITTSADIQTKEEWMDNLKLDENSFDRLISDYSLLHYIDTPVSGGYVAKLIKDVFFAFSFIVERCDKEIKEKIAGDGAGEQSYDYLKWYINNMKFVMDQIEEKK